MATHPAAPLSPPPVRRQIVQRHLDAFRLTCREKEIVYWLFYGCANKEIADRCKITVETVKDHLKHVYHKTGVHQRLALLARLLH